jgi:SNF2 family DNA or RNA helicase
VDNRAAQFTENSAKLPKKLEEIWLQGIECMQVLHSIWDTETFHIWSESSALPLVPDTPNKRPKKPLAHPFAPTGTELRGHLSESFHIDGCDISALILQLPSGKSGPLPSHWLLREDYVPQKAVSLIDCIVTTLALKPDTALDFLLNMPLQESQGITLADSMLFWSKLALFSLELVAREQFVPVVREGRSLWKAVLDGSDEERLKVFSSSMPPSCLASRSLQAARISSRSLVGSFLDSAVDSIVRNSLKQTPLLPPRRGRKPLLVPVQQQFLQALTSEDPALSASDEEIASFARKLDTWTSELQPKAIDEPFRTCFRLESPAESDESWRLSFFLQSKEDRSLLVPASDVWRTRSGALTLLKKRLKNPQEQLLADLGRAVRVFPGLEKSLDRARPTSLEMETEAAYDFLRQSAPLLEQNGFGVLLPSWWHSPGTGLGVRVHLKDFPQKSGKVGPCFFGLDSIVEYDWQLSLGENALTEAEFAELARLKVPLIQVRGQWMELRPQDTEAAIEFFQKNKDQKMTLAEALRLGLGEGSGLDLSGGLTDTKSGLPVLGFQAEGRIKEILSALSEPGGHMEPIQTPRDFFGTPRPYQLRGVSWLMYLNRLGLGACLADDMGLGKTIELIAFLLREREELAGGSSDKIGPRPVLLICPMSVAGNWQREIERFAPDLQVLMHHGLGRFSGQSLKEEAETADVVITTYALAQRDEEDLSAVAWDHIVLDEAQSIKNQSARQTQSIKRLKAKQKIALTGTPVENRLSELWSIMDFLNPGYLGSFDSFRKNFVHPIEKHNSKSHSQLLRSLIQPFVLRRLKTDATVIKDLPEKLEMKVNYNLTREQATLYAAVVDEMLEQIESTEGMQRKGLILATLTKLKQVCNHPALFLQDGSSLEGRSGKLTRLEEMLEEVVASGDRALVFTQYAGMGAMLRHQVHEKLGVESLFLHGKTTRSQREEMVQRFQEGRSPIFILSLKAGGFGLNLTAANHVFHYDRWWNPAVENQATDRAFRIGQKKNVFVHKFVCQGTLEDRIDQMIEKKKALAESVIGSGETWLTELSNEALRELISLRQDSVADGGD